jgi:hypothetical protein
MGHVDFSAEEKKFFISISPELSIVSVDSRCLKMQFSILEGQWPCVIHL